MTCSAVLLLLRACSAVFCCCCAPVARFFPIKARFMPFPVNIYPTDIKQVKRENIAVGIYREKARYSAQGALQMIVHSQYDGLGNTFVAIYR